MRGLGLTLPTVPQTRLPAQALHSSLVVAEVHLPAGLNSMKDGLQLKLRETVSRNLVMPPAAYHARKHLSPWSTDPVSTASVDVTILSQPGVISAHQLPGLACVASPYVAVC